MVESEMRYSGRWGIRVSGGEGRCARGVQAENGGAGQKARACWRWLRPSCGVDERRRVETRGREGQHRACACGGRTTLRVCV